MFCESCGSRLAEGVNFCTTCGAQVKHHEGAVTPAPVIPQGAPPAAPQIMPQILAQLVSQIVPELAPQFGTQFAPPPPSSPPSSAPSVPRPSAPPVQQPGLAGTRCSWCGSPLAGGVLSCPACGGKVSEMGVSTRSGWLQLPGRKDMAKLQFGQSTCQIEGIYVPVADFNLAAGDSVYFAHHVLLWKDSATAVTTMPLKGAWKRVFCGMPLIMTQAAGPGHIAFSRDAPGELIAIPIHPGQSVDVREHLFLSATGNVVYDWFNTNVWLQTRNGDDTETHYPIGMYMDRFSGTAQPGLLLLHAAGNVFIRTLADGESMLVKPTALIFKDPLVQMHLHFEHPQVGWTSWGSWSNRYLWLRVIGPGRIGVQSSFEQLEGESRIIQSASYATETRW